jgi:hypothetical protein
MGLHTFPMKLSTVDPMNPVTSSSFKMTEVNCTYPLPSLADYYQQCVFFLYWDKKKACVDS